MKQANTKITADPKKLRLAYKVSIFQIVAGIFLILVALIPTQKDYAAASLGLLIAAVGLRTAILSRR